MTALDVTIGGYTTATTAFESGNHHAATTFDGLVGKLQGYAAMAGDASIADDFASAYDEGAAEALDALVDVVEAFANLGRMTLATLDNHRKADQRSVLPGAVITPDGSLPETGFVKVLPTTVPSSLGGDPASLPGWATMILDHIEGFVWPDADTDRLREAAATWRAAADDVELLTAYCDYSVGGLWRERSPEVPVAVAATEELAATIRDLAPQLVTLAAACETYADDVEAQRDAILDLVRALLRDAILIQGIGIVLGAVTAGSTAAGAGALNATILAAQAHRFLRIMAVLRSLAAASATTIRAATSAVRAVRVRLLKYRAVHLAGRSSELGMLSLGGRLPGWLRAQEVKGGHTISRHVGRTDQQLLRRFRDQPTLRMSSTFNDARSAERSLERVLASESKKIDAWLRGASPSLRVVGPAMKNIGRCMDRSGNLFDPSHVRVILRRDPSTPDGFRVHTAFPDL